MTQNETTSVRHWLTDVDRDNVMKLANCGLSSVEIATITHISRSSINNIRQAHQACVDQDWSTLQRLSTTIRHTVDWAMRVTGVDKVFAETFHQGETPVDKPAGDDASNKVDPRNLYEMYEVLTDIRSLLTDIRDALK